MLVKTSNSVRILALANHPLAWPAVERLAAEGRLAAVGAPRRGPLADSIQRWAGATIRAAYFDEADFPDSLAALLAEVRPDAAFVLCFPFRIPATALLAPRHGFLNFHTGLLPAYRGIEPVFWQIRERSPTGGVAVHQMTDEFDAGPVAHVEPLAIGPQDTYGRHTQLLAGPMLRAAEAVLAQLEQGALQFRPQPIVQTSLRLRPAPEELHIAWHLESADSIEALTLAANPAYGGAETRCGETILRILQVSTLPPLDAHHLPPGVVSACDATAGLRIRSRDGRDVRLDVVYSEAGLLDGVRTANFFGILPGRRFG